MPAWTAPAPRDERLGGAGLVLAASALLGANAVAAKLSYEAGVTVVAVLAARYVASALVVGPLALGGRRRGGRQVTPGALLALAGSYLASATAYFGALQLGRVTDVAPLVFLYPAIVAAVGVLALGEDRDRRRLLGIGLAIAGSACVFGAPTADAGDLPAKALALVAAAGTAVYFVVSARSFAAGGTVQGVAAMCALGALVYLPVLALAPPAAGALDAAWPYLVAMAVGGTALPLGLLTAGVARVGSTPAAVLSLFEPVVTVGLALVLLGEELRPVQLAGTALVLGSFPLVVRPGGRVTAGSG